MKIFSMIGDLGKALFQPADDASEIESWQRDPLSHPDIAAMGLRDLADLPFTRTMRVPDAGLRCH